MQASKLSLLLSQLVNYPLQLMDKTTILILLTFSPSFETAEKSIENLLSSLLYYALGTTTHVQVALLPNGSNSTINLFREFPPNKNNRQTKIDDHQDMLESIDDLSTTNGVNISQKVIKDATRRLPRSSSRSSTKSRDHVDTDHISTSRSKARKFDRPTHLMDESQSSLPDSPSYAQIPHEQIRPSDGTYPPSTQPSAEHNSDSDPPPPPHESIDHDTTISHMTCGICWDSLTNGPITSCNACDQYFHIECMRNHNMYEADSEEPLSCPCCHEQWYEG